MKRIKITLPKGGIKESSKVIGETTKSIRLSVSAHTVVYDAEEIIIEGDGNFFGNVNASTPAPLPFDLEAAKAGAPLVTRGGRKAHFVAHDPGAKESFRLLVRIEGDQCASAMPVEGAWKGVESLKDLFMAPKPKRTVWVNFYSNRIAHYHDSEEFAKKGAGADCIATVPVEIDA